MAGEYAVYRHGTGGTNYDSTSYTNFVYETAVYTDALVKQNGGGSSFTLGASGHWLISYDMALETDGGSNRSERNSRIVIDSAVSKYGRGSTFIRRASSHNFGHINSSAIVNLASDDLDVEIEVARTDTNTTGLVDTADNSSGVQFLKLDDNWEYYRAYNDSSQALTSEAEPLGNTEFSDYTQFTALEFTNDDEKDAGYTHSTSTNPEDITLDEAGLYLVCYTVSVQTTINQRSNVLAKLTLGGTDLDGTSATGYVRTATGTQDCNDATASWTGLIRAASASQVLNLEAVNDNSDAAATLNVVACSITIVRVPDVVTAVGRRHAIIDSDYDASKGTLTPFDLQVNDETGSDWALSGSDGWQKSEATANDPCLVVGHFYQSYTATLNGRKSPEARVWLAATEVQYGGGSAYNRGNQGGYSTQSAANSCLAIIEADSGDEIQVGGIDQSGAGSGSTAWRGDHTGVQVLRLAPVFDYRFSLDDDGLTLQPVSIAAAGTVADPAVTGTSSLSLQPASIDSASTQAITGSAALTLKAPRIDSGTSPLGAWIFYRDIVHDGTDINSDLTNHVVPVVIDGTVGDEIALNARADGLDIVFATSDGITILDYEIKSWDDTEGVLEAWVKVPTLNSSGNTTIRVYYGNADNTTEYSSANDTWISDYKIVIHGDGDPTGTATILDSSGNGNHFSDNGEMLVTDSVAAKIGLGLQFDVRGADEGVVLANADQVGLNLGSYTDDYEVSFWCKSNTPLGNNNHRMICWEESSPDFTGFALYIRPDGSLQFFCRADSNNTPASVRGSTDLDDGNWHHVVVQKVGAASSDFLVYVDGVEESTGDSGTLTAGNHTSNAEMIIGNQTESTATGLGYDGVIDEVRIRTGRSTADEITASYASENDNAAFWAIGSQQGEFKSESSVTLQSAQISSAGALSFSASASLTLQPALIGSASQQTFEASSALMLRSAELSSAGTSVDSTIGTAALTLLGPGVNSVAELVFSASATIDLFPASIAATGAKTISGSSSVLLFPATTSSTSVQGLSATAALELHPASISAAASVQFVSDASLSLQPASIASAGTVANPVTGTAAFDLFLIDLEVAGESASDGGAALTLFPMSVSSTGTILNPVTGSVDVSFFASSITSEALLSFTATSATALVAVDLSSTGTLSISGTSALVFQAAQLACTAELVFAAVSALDLFPFSTSSNGTANDNLVATTSVTLQAPSIASAGALSFSAATTIALQPASIGSTASLQFIADASLSLQQASISSAGTVLNGVTGTSELSLVPATISGTVEATADGGASITLQPASISATGALAFSGSTSLELLSASIDSTAALVFSSAVSLALQPANPEAAGAVLSSGMIALELTPVSVSSSASLTFSASASFSLQSVSLTAVGDSLGGAATLELQPAQISSIGVIKISGSSAIELPAAQIDSFGGGVVAGTSAIDLQPINLEAAAALVFQASAVITLVEVNVDSEGLNVVQIVGTSVVGLPTAEVASEVNLEFSGASSLTLGSVTISSTDAPLLVDCIDLDAGWTATQRVPGGWKQTQKVQGGFETSTSVSGGVNSC